MSSPVCRFRVLPTVGVGLSAFLGLLAAYAGSNAIVRPAPLASSAAAVRTFPLMVDAGGPNLMFVSLPGIGSAVMSLGPDGKPVFLPATLHQDELTFSMNGRQLNLSGVGLPAPSRSRPSHFLIHLDRGGLRAHGAPAVQPKTAPSTQTAPHAA